MDPSQSNKRNSLNQPGNIIRAIVGSGASTATAETNNNIEMGPMTSTGKKKTKTDLIEAIIDKIIDEGKTNADLAHGTVKQKITKYLAMTPIDTSVGEARHGTVRIDVPATPKQLSTVVTPDHFFKNPLAFRPATPKQLSTVVTPDHFFKDPLAFRLRATVTTQGENPVQPSSAGHTPKSPTWKETFVEE